MTSRAVARRYAMALFDVMERRGTTDTALPILETFRDLVGGHAELRAALSAPSVPGSKKRAIVEALYAATGGGGDEMKRLLLLLADRDRLMLLPDIAALFKERVGQARRQVPAEVVTAVPLDDRRRAALAAALGVAAGSGVTLNARVDPGILGGVIARVGSQVFDGSITRQLARMKQRLLAE